MNSRPTATPAASTADRCRRRGKLLIAGAVLTVAAGTVASMLTGSSRRGRADLVTHTARYERLELDIVSRGELDSVDNRDVYCRVKAGTRNSTIATTIKWVIDEGATVKKGDRLIELDDSGLQEELKEQKTTLDRAQTDKVLAEESYKIVASQNESDVQTAATTLVLSRIDLRKYVEGDYPQALKDLAGRYKVAESDLEMQRDRAAWALRMLRKGFQTVNQAQAEQSRFESFEIAMGKVREENRVLTDPAFGMRKRTETGLANSVFEAKRTGHRVKSQARAREVQARADRALKRSIHGQELARYREIEDEISKCTILAPREGMVVYCLSEQARSGGGSQQSIIAQGEPVREGQKLMQIPDMGHMLVDTSIHEALVTRVRRGLPASVRVDAYPDRVYPGHVEHVAAIASVQGWFSADNKVFAMKVAIDEAVEGLRPGMSAEVTIEFGNALKQMLTVPVEALVGSVEMGNRRHCYVLTPDGTEEREVVVGLSNTHMVQIKEGLREGDEVVLNPRELAGETIATRKPSDLAWATLDAGQFDTSPKRQRVTANPR